MSVMSETNEASPANAGSDLERLVRCLRDESEMLEDKFAQDRYMKALLSESANRIERLLHIANEYAVHLPDCEWFDSNDTPCSCGYEKSMAEMFYT